jgi:hypothetical protein
VDEAQALAQSYIQSQMRARGGGKSPARDQLVSFSRTPGVAVPDEVKRDMLSSGASPEAVEQGAARASTIAENVRNARNAQIEGEQRSVADQEARRAQVDAQINAKRELIASRDAELEQVEPRNAAQVVEDKGFGAVAMASVLAGMQGFLNARSGTQGNAVIEMWERSINKQIEDDRTKYERAKERGIEARGDYAEAIRVYGTPEAAELDMRARYTALHEKALENYAGQIGDEGLKMQAAQQAGQLRERRAETRMRLFEMESGKVQQEQ